MLTKPQCLSSFCEVVAAVGAVASATNPIGLVAGALQAALVITGFRTTLLSAQNTDALRVLKRFQSETEKNWVAWSKVSSLGNSSDQSHAIADLDEYFRDADEVALPMVEEIVEIRRRSQIEVPENWSRLASQLIADAMLTRAAAEKPHLFQDTHENTLSRRFLRNIAEAAFNHLLSNPEYQNNLAPVILDLIAADIGRMQQTMEAVKQASMRQIPLSDALKKALANQITGCRKLNVPFRTPHILLAIFQARDSSAIASMNTAQEGFADHLRQQLETFIANQVTIEENTGYIDVELTSHPVILAAQSEALTYNSPVVAGRHLLLTLLDNVENSESATILQIAEHLGQEGLEQLRSSLKNQQSDASAINGTPDIGL